MVNQKNNRNQAMKKILIILLFALTSAFLNDGFAQGPPPPPGGGGMNGGHGQGGNFGKKPTGAPIGGGLEILLLLGAAYAGRKVHQMRKEGEEE